MHDYVIVDAFTRQPLRGNPVAVFFDCDNLTADLMQRIANEMHLSETAFVLRPQLGGDARVRIFTPVNELPFAGHPMLGTAVALAEKLGHGKLQLETAMGVIPFRVTNDDGTTEVQMEQPLPVWELYDRGPELLAALGVENSIAPVEAYRNGPRHVFVGMPDIATLSALHPDHRALADFPDMAANCFAGGAGSRWRIRMFSPAYGVVEDAATGSAAGPLAVHLARHGLAAWTQTIEIEQGVEIGRPSLMKAVAFGNNEQVTAVNVSGHGVVIARGTFFI